MVNRFFIDTEFNEVTETTADGRKVPVIDLISIGVVAEDGREYYAVSNEFNRVATEQDEWMADNVLSKLPPESEWKSRAEIARDLNEFFGKQPLRLYYWVAAADAVAISQLLSPSFLQLPRNISQVMYDLGQCYQMFDAPQGIVPAHPEDKDRHTAIADARWLKQLYVNMRQCADEKGLKIEL